jgi:CRISPR system Cascade subunit CasC
MKHMELHILQSVPVTCLNRDDLNSPKTTVFGGIQRARVSSQAWKRAIRELAEEVLPDEKNGLFSGNRTRRFVFALKNRLFKREVPAKSSEELAEQVADIVETLDTKKVDSEGCKKIKTMMFFSESEYDAIADLIANSADVKDQINLIEKSIVDEDKKKKEKILKKMNNILKKGAIAKAIKSVQLKDAADIALFGRMVASDASLSVEASTMFSHALSTHKVDNEIDFFSAVDDLQTEEESGAAITSTLEFNSATYYRFAALNLDMLADENHLAAMSLEERQSVVRTFLEATIKAMPGARKSSMNGNTLPVYVLGVVRNEGHPLQLVNAFETPLFPTSRGYAAESVKKMNVEYADIKNTWGIDSDFSKAVVKGSLTEEVKETLGAIETCSFEGLLKEMVQYVV